MKALEGLRSVDISYTKYNKTEDYPRRSLSEYDDRHTDNHAPVLSTKWELDDDDRDALVLEFGEGAIKKDQASINKHYGRDGNTFWVVPINEAAVLKRLIKRFGLTEKDSEPIVNMTTTEDAAEVLNQIENRSESQTELLEAIKIYRDSRASLRAIDILSQRMPRFLYFSHYDRMSGAISINQLKQNQEIGCVSEGEQVFLDFLEYAGTNLEELTKATRFEEMNAKCEAAANRITDQIFEYWTQNDQLSIEVRLDEGKSDNEPPFDEGTVARARVKNNIHRVTVPFSERSAGFIWFFSFLVKFAQIKKRMGKVIVLLDEPGLTLHGTAQKDLLRYFKEQLEPHHQLIYSTHSPFMVPADNLGCVRTVEDVVRLDERNRLISEGTKIRHDVLTTDPQTNFPVFGAMGFEVTQGLIIATNTLLVEGPADILYLQAVSERLKSLNRTHLNSRWAICPSGGIDKILPFVRLFYRNNLNVVVLTDFDRAQRRKLDLLYQAELLEKERIILATEIAKQDEADIEDFFDPQFYAELLNNTYQLRGKQKLSEKKLKEVGSNTPRLVKKAETYFCMLPDIVPNFGHFGPAMYLLRNPAMLEAEGEAVEKTLDRFEEAFRRIEKYANWNTG